MHELAEVDLESAEAVAVQPAGYRGTGLDAAITADRFDAGEYSDWADLIDSTAVIPVEFNLEQVQEFFRRNEDLKYAAVLDGDKIVGLCSERRISRILSMRGGLGYAVYSKNSVLRHLRSDHLLVNRGAPVLKVLDLVMARSDNFFDDVVLTDENGKYLGLISARTLMLLQHRISHQQLGALQNMTSELNQNNADLARARDEARQAAQSKSVFLANMSHEIRTPLNGILGMIKILMRTQLGTEQRRFATTVLNSANALLTILNDILDFSKIEAGKMVFESVEVDLTDVLEEVVQLLSERASEKKIDIFSWVDPGVCTKVLADPTRLRQVILNLASNAVKFTEKGEVVLRIQRVVETQSHVELRVSVADTGIGISPEAQERLFGAFEQADTSTSRRYGGTGLGLAICKRIVALMDGKIGLDSEVGRGSTFWFEACFPKKQAEAGQGAPEAALATDFAGLRVLLASESTSFGAYLGNQLESWNTVCRRVGKGAQVLELLDQPQAPAFDCVFIDNRITDLDASGLAGQMHKLKKQCRHVFLIAAFREEVSPELRQEQGITDILVRPVRPAALRALLMMCRSGEGTGTGIATPPPFVKAKQVLPEPPSHVQAGKSGEVPALSILLVEDSPVNREVAVYMLEDWGHRVECAENGREALDKLAAQTYDCVLMDCQMPVMDGYEATAEIRKSAAGERNKSIFIIAMTANAMAGDRERCLEAGMNDYVGKPVVEADLLRALHRAHGQVRGEPLPEDRTMQSGRDAAVEDEPYFPKRLMEMFVSETEARLNELCRALAGVNIEETRRIVHTIKGTAGNFRAHRLYDLAKEMELLAADGNPEGVWELLPQAREAFNEVRLNMAGKQS